MSATSNHDGLPVFTVTFHRGKASAGTLETTKVIVDAYNEFYAYSKAVAAIADNSWRPVLILPAEQD